MIRFLLLFFSVFIFCKTATYAQNLIFNPSFEERDSCPTENPNQVFKFCKNWMQATKGTPDLYAPCNIGYYSIPRSGTGYCTPLSGTSYSGMLLYAVYGMSGKEYREYIETKLAEPLIAGEKYHFIIYVKPSGGFGDDSRCYCNSIGMYFSEKIVKADSFGVLDYKPQITNQFRMMEDTSKWQVVSGEFTAKGGERYLTIGNFKRNKDTKTKFVKEKRQAMLGGEEFRNSYYYLDNIYVLPKSKLNSIESELSAFDELPNIPLWRGRVIPLKNIYFPFDKSNLNKPSVEELDKLVDLMTTNKRLDIKIIGYADTIGNNAYNLELSLKRAEAVKNYLIKKGGFKERRITIEAKGDTCPVNDNATEEKRKINRRVVIIVTRC
ncbi:MAG: OmpA family protein [Bacteroidota bacterium]